MNTTPPLADERVVRATLSVLRSIPTYGADELVASVHRELRRSAASDVSLSPEQIRADVIWVLRQIQMEACLDDDADDDE